MRTVITGAALLLVGIAAVVGQLEPLAAVCTLWARVWPILLFVAAMTIVAELAADAGVFTAISARMARWSRGRAWALWLLVCVLCITVTVFLSLDTTAILITPVVIAMVRPAGLRVLPFALVTVWWANTASLLLPVSNLTNLLAQEVTQQSTPQFVALSWAPALVAVLVPLAVVVVVVRHELGVRFPTPSVADPADRTLFTVSIVVVAALLPALVSGVPVWIPTSVAALILLLVFALRRPTRIRVGMVPWPLLIFAGGLFLVIDCAHRLGLGAVLAAATGEGTGFFALLRVAGIGAASANLVNNLPAYLALAPTAAGHGARMMALLIGVNCGAVITPWASLATLLWHDRLKALGVTVRWYGFMLLGLIVAPLTVVASVAALASVT